MPDDARYRDPRFMALEADPDYQEYLAEREKAGVPWLAGTELHDALYKQGWAARYEKLLVRHGIALGEIEFEPTTWPAPASIAEMEQRLTRLIDLDESATRIWRRAGYGDPPATEKHADDARCIARMVDKLGVDATAPLRRIGPKLTRDEEQDIYLELLGLVRAAQKTAEPPAQANTDRGEPGSEPPDDSFLSAAKLAELFGVAPDPLRKRLDRWRMSNGDGWMENPDAASRTAKFLYRVGSVRPIIADARAGAERAPKKKPSEKTR